MSLPAPHPDRPSVDVIVVAWQSDAWLGRCLSHLAAQTRRPDTIWLVDNGGTAGLETEAARHANVRVLRPAANLGFAGGNNAALAQCGAEWVALLNPDAFPAPDWLERLLDAATAARPDAAGFGSRQLRDSEPAILDGVGDSYHLTGWNFRLGWGRPQGPQDLCGKPIFAPCAAAALYRRQALRDVGDFDADYFCYGEDIDLGFRLRLAGYHCFYVPEAVVRHVGSATTGGQQGDFAVYHGHRNLVWTFVKNMPGALFWALLPLHLALNLVELLWFLPRGRLMWRAKRDAWKALPEMWKVRRRIQAHRTASLRDVWDALDKRLIPGR